MTDSTCRSCGAPIVWRTRSPRTEGEKSRPIPCDPPRLLIRLDVDGTDTMLVCEDGEVRSGLRVRDVARTGMPVGTYCTGRVAHFATCPDADRHRR